MEMEKVLTVDIVSYSRGSYDLPLNCNDIEYNFLHQT